MRLRPVAIHMNYPKFATVAPYLLRYEIPDPDGKSRYYASAVPAAPVTTESVISTPI